MMQFSGRDPAPLIFESAASRRGVLEIVMLLIILVVLLVVSLGGGGFGYSRYGAAGMGPAGFVLLVLAVLYFTGHLR